MIIIFIWGIKLYLQWYSRFCLLKFLNSISTVNFICLLKNINRILLHLDTMVGDLLKSQRKVKVSLKTLHLKLKVQSINNLIKNTLEPINSSVLSHFHSLFLIKMLTLNSTYPMELCFLMHIACKRWGKQQDGRAQQYHTFIQAILSFELCKPSLLNKWFSFQKLESIHKDLQIHPRITANQLEPFLLQISSLRFEFCS